MPRSEEYILKVYSLDVNKQSYVISEKDNDDSEISCIISKRMLESMISHPLSR